MRRRTAGFALLAAAFLAGCAAPARQTVDDGSAFWSGRLALQVESESPQSFAASFELKGSAERGELLLFSPLGQTLARLAWSPQQAHLQANGEERAFESLDALAAHVTGTALPVAALFDWLAGRERAVPGWQADLSQLQESNRLVARRSMPLPVAVLRVALQR